MAMIIVLTPTSMDKKIVMEMDATGTTRIFTNIIRTKNYTATALPSVPQSSMQMKCAQFVLVE